jgi:hypothetical protein
MGGGDGYTKDSDRVFSTLQGSKNNKFYDNQDSIMTSNRFENR